MKSGAAEIVGRRISGLIVKEGDTSPRSQVFLLFDDGTYYEFYTTSDDIRGAGGVDRGGCDSVLSYLRGPTRDPVFAVLAAPTEQQVADREIALGWIRTELRRRTIDLRLLQLALERVTQAGLDWRVLYEEARAVRPPEWEEPPATDAL